jgi:hypothetical protein
LVDLSVGVEHLPHRLVHGGRARSQRYGLLRQGKGTRGVSLAEERLCFHIEAERAG